MGAKRPILTSFTRSPEVSRNGGLLARLIPHVLSSHNQKAPASSRLDSTNSPGCLGICLACEPSHLCHREAFFHSHLKPLGRVSETSKVTRSDAAVVGRI